MPSAENTDGRGAFRFERVPPGEYRLETVVYPGWGDVVQAATNRLLRTAAGDQVGPRDFVFEAPEDRGGLAGQVVEAASGNPVEAFTIRVVEVDSPGAGSPVHGCVQVDGDRLPWTASRPASWSQGPFLISDISPGIATLEISAEGCAPGTERIMVPSGQTTNVTITLQPEGVLKGQAMRQGRPCAHGYVNRRRVGEAPEAGVDTHTDQRGFYEYRGLPSGEYLLRVGVWLREDRLSAQLTDVAQVRVEAGQTTRMDLDFGRRAGIRGSFRAPDQDLSWFVVVEDVSPQAANLAPPDRVRGTAWKIERTGEYSLEGLAPGTYRITAKCLRRDESMTPVVQQSKTFSPKDGEKWISRFRRPRDRSSRR